MNEILWLFPILFIFHDMEEIIGYGLWLSKNRAFLDAKYPKISNTYKPYSTEGMAAAVMEELVICLIVCVITRFTGFYGLWFGAFVAYTLHLIIHIRQSLLIKKYIPAVITSVICLPISIWLIIKSAVLLPYSAVELIIYSVVGTLIIALNLKLAHKIIHKFTDKFEVKEF
ncbi:MAG: HXXEE domain-containing protein [Ruminococcus sp.]|nr:HXXEE domain-containing protein [Ruminococcus sp.]